MEYQLQINTKDEQFSAFLGRGSLYPFEKSISLHYHSFTEIHIILNGKYEYNVHGKRFTLSKGEIAVFPPNFFHQAEGKERNSGCIAFQISKIYTEFLICRLDAFYCEAIEKAIKEFLENENCNPLRSMILMVIGAIENNNLPDFEPICNKKHLIESFLSENFSKNVKLSELASVLNVCEKQASRLVKKYIGNDFKHEISKRRVEAAIRLMNDTNMSLDEIAVAVGYKSYSGLWKAITKKVNK